MAWLRTGNGAINTRYVHEVYVYKSNQLGWSVAANMGYDPSGKKIGIILNVPELTGLIENEIDARKAIDKLMDVINFQEEYED